MSAKHPLTPGEQAAILTMRRDKNLSVTQIAFRIGRGPDVVSAELKRIGLAKTDRRPTRGVHITINPDATAAYERRGEGLSDVERMRAVQQREIDNWKRPLPKAEPND